MMEYVLKSVVLFSILYLPYLLLLRRETFFRFNRAVMLLILGGALLFPFVSIYLPQVVTEPLAKAVQTGIEMMVDQAVTADFTVGETDASFSTNGVPFLQPFVVNGMNWLHLLIVVYICGALLTFVLKLIQYIKLRQSMSRGVLWIEKRDNITILCKADNVAPFSWMRTVVISEADYALPSQSILLHEIAHVRSGHSWDILLLSIVQIVQWFNPLVWLAGASLREVHEYEADNSVLKAGVVANDYQMLLISKVTGIPTVNMANGFSRSLLAWRVRMMLKSRKVPFVARMKVVLLAMLMFLSVGIVGAELPLDYMGEVVDNRTAPVGVDTCYVGNAPAVSNDATKRSKSKDAPDIELPYAYPYEAYKAGVTGVVYVDMVVTPDGKAKNIRAVTSDIEIQKLRKAGARFIPLNCGIISLKSRWCKTAKEGSPEWRLGKKALNIAAVNALKQQKQMRPRQGKGKYVAGHIVYKVVFCIVDDINSLWV